MNAAPQKAKANRLWRSHSADIFRWMDAKGFLVEYPPGQVVPHGKKKTWRYVDGYTDATVAALYMAEFPDAPPVFQPNLFSIRRDYFGDIYRAVPKRKPSAKRDLSERVETLEARLLYLERALGVEVAPPKANGAHKSPA